MSTAREYRAKALGTERFAAAAASLRRMVERRADLGTPGQQAGPDWLRHVPEGVRDLVSSGLPGGVLDLLGAGSSPAGVPPGSRAADSPDAGLGAGTQFLSASFSNQAGTRPYKLFVPSGYKGQPVPLIVMLHGCTQSPDDFAAGTAMNEAAEERTCLVAYPGQTTSAHAQKCWKWFSAEDQQRGRGEPSLIAGITHQVMLDYAVDPRRVYVAGLSAGGAAAAIMGDAYPELYAAIGVHSGLACGAARDLPSALAVMKRGGAGRRRGSASEHRIVPAIVFHGDRDTTVNPRNGDDVISHSVQGADLRLEVQNGRSAAGRDFTRTISTDNAGQVVAEQWVVRGTAHAWSGGRSTGSYTDPRGPDATKEMLRFFDEHPHTTLPQGR